MTLKIGIVAGAYGQQATQIKAELLALNPTIEVLLDTHFQVRPAESTFVESDLKIDTFLAVQRLAEAGAQVIGFANDKVHTFLSELQTEIRLPMVDPVDIDGCVRSAKDYADRLLTIDSNPLPGSYKIGVVGGLGPAATVDLYDKITRLTPAKNDQEHFKLVVEQNPQTPDRTAALLDGGIDPTLALFHSAQLLVKDGCECLVIPCNTAHAFWPRIARHLKVDFIDMQQSTLDEIQAQFGENACVGLMATTGTVRTGIYGDKAKAMGLKMVAPDSTHQQLVMSAIYGPNGVKAGQTTGQCHTELCQAASYLVGQQGCNVLILGCTELPLILKEGWQEFDGQRAFVIDPTMAVARAVVRKWREKLAERGVR